MGLVRGLSLAGWQAGRSLQYQEPCATACDAWAKEKTVCGSAWGHHSAVSSAGLKPIVTMYACTKAPCVVQPSLHRSNTLGVKIRIIALNGFEAFLYTGYFSGSEGMFLPTTRITNPLVVSQTCVLCFSSVEDKHIVEQRFGKTQVCCWIWGLSITAWASQRCLGLG